MDFQRLIFKMRPSWSLTRREIAPAQDLAATRSVCPLVARQRNLGFRRAPRRCIFKGCDHPESLEPAAFYHQRRLNYPFDSRSHECARPKPKPCRSTRPRRRQNRTALSQARGGALFHPRRRGRDRTRRRTSNGRPGRCDPHSSRRVAHDHGYRAATLSLLLRAALCARGYVFRITGRAMVRPTVVGTRMQRILEPS